MKTLNLSCLRIAPVLGAVALSLVAGVSAHAADWSYAEAAKPYAGTRIRVLDEITPLQETMRKLVPQFTKETGIEVEYELLSHGDVINKGQADLFSRRGYYDAIMLHGLQLGPLFAGKLLEPIDGYLQDAKLGNPAMNEGDFIEPASKSLVSFAGKQYGFLTWNYNQVYWGRKDLLEHPAEQAAFQAKYGYPLAPASTMSQLRDIAEFFTRKAGEPLAGEPLKSDFYGIVLEGIPGGTTFTTVWEVFLRNWGGGLLDDAGRPAFDSQENIDALAFWAELWKFAPPGQAEYSLVDVPTVMGNGIAAQSIAWSDFVLGVDRPNGGAYAGKFVYAGIPTNPQTSAPHSAGGEPSLMALSRASKNKEATFLFMQWLVDAKTQATLLEEGGGGVPIRTSSFALPVMQAPERQSLYGAMKDSLGSVVAKPRLPNFFEIDAALAPIVQQVGMGTLTPQQGVAQGQKALRAVCDPCALAP